MFRRRKRSIGLLHSLGLVASLPLVFLVSAGQVTGLKRSEVAKVVADRSYLTYINSDAPSPFSYWFDPSGYGSFQSGLQRNYFSLPLIRYVAFGKQKLKTEFKVVDGEVVASNKVESPIFQALKFFAVEKVVVTTFDGKNKVYDSDDYDKDLVKEGLDKGLPVVTLLSRNPRSINSLNFEKDLQGARRFLLIPRHNLHYVDSKGAKTKYKLRAKDFLYSYLRNFARGKVFRHANGGSQELDDHWYERTANSLFTTAQYPNEYLFELFDVDSDAWKDQTGKAKHKAIEKIKIGKKVYEAFSIYRKSNKINKGDPNLFNSFLQQFARSFLFSPVSSEYIEERAKKGKDWTYGSGLVKQIGYYWYPEEREQALFIGSHVPVDVSKEASEFVITYKPNPHYFDEAFIRSKDALKDVVISYRKQEPRSYSQSIYADFIQGRINVVGFSELEEETLNAILNNKESKIPRERVTFNINLNSMKMPAFSYISIPGEIKGSDGKPNTEGYEFNEIFSKFIFGASLEELAKGEAKVVPHFFGDEQISFRTLLNAGVNWSTVFNRVSSGNQLFNLTNIPPYGQLAGSDAATSRYKTPKDVPFINDPFVVFEGKRVLTIPNSINLANVNAIKESESLMGGGKENYEKLQEMMTTLLDKVYKEKGFKPSDTMLIPWAIRFLDRLEKVDNATEAALRTMEQLDKKGRLKFKFVKFKDRKERNDFYDSGKSFLHVRGWTNDYDGNGSSITALLGENPFYVAFLKLFSKRKEKDPNNPFPLLTRLSKLLKEGVESGKYKFKVPFEEWDKLTNEQIFHATRDTFAVTDEDKKKGIEPVDTILAKFFFDVQSKFTNEEHARLDVEIAALLGPMFTGENSTANVERGSGRLFQKGFYVPYNSFGISFPQDFIFDPLEDK